MTYENRMLTVRRGNTVRFGGHAYTYGDLLERDDPAVRTNRAKFILAPEKLLSAQSEPEPEIEPTRVEDAESVGEEEATE